MNSKLFIIILITLLILLNKDNCINHRKIENYSSDTNNKIIIVLNEIENMYYINIKNDNSKKYNIIKIPI